MPNTSIYVTKGFLVNPEEFSISSLLEFHGFDSILLITLLILGLVVGNVIRLSFISYILFWAPKDRPINVLICIDHSVAFLTITTLSSMIIASLMKSTSIMDLLGPWACWSFVTAITINWMNSTAGGLFLVVYRFLCTFCYNLTHNIIGKDTLVRIFIGTQFILVGIGVCMWQATSEISGNGIAMEFCRGQNPEIADIFTTYTLKTLGYDSQGSGLWFKTVILGFALVATFMELILYVVIFIDMYYHDKSMIKNLGQDNVRKRHRKNAITLAGEATCFVIEFMANVLFSLLLNQFFGDSRRAFAPVIYCLAATLRAIFQLQASPELKQHLNLI